MISLVLIVCFLLISLIIFYLWSVTIAIIDRTENQLILKTYRSMCNYEISKRYDIDRMSRIAIHRETVTMGWVERMCGGTSMYAAMKKLTQWKGKQDRIYHVTFMTQVSGFTWHPCIY